MTDAVDRIRRLVADCITLRKYVNYIAFLFGWPRAIAEARSQEERLEELLVLQQEMSDANRRKSYEAENDLDALVMELEHEKEQAAKSRDFWRANPIPIRCDDATLESLALRVRRGPPVILTKPQIEEVFDFSGAVHFWDWIPEYVRIWFQFGMIWSYPDVDLFRAMAFFHDEALRASRGVATALSEMSGGTDRRATLFRGLSLKKMYACQSIVNACLLVEAFLNGLASVALSRKDASLSTKERLYLSEKQEKDGAVRQKFISTQDKLAEWVRILSSRNEGLDRERNPYQDFNRILELRHSIVHLERSKIGIYESIGQEKASVAATAAIEVIREICRCLAKDSEKPAFPGWLKSYGADGFFQSNPNDAANAG
jgi:hypothetical protein